MDSNISLGTNLDLFSTSDGKSICAIASENKEFIKILDEVRKYASLEDMAILVSAIKKAVKHIGFTAGLKYDIFASVVSLIGYGVVDVSSYNDMYMFTLNNIEKKLRIYGYLRRYLGNLYGKREIFETSFQILTKSVPYFSYDKQASFLNRSMATDYIEI